MQKPLILGHRGCVIASCIPYQNTMDAYIYALDRADGFECDVVRSKDGSLYLMHPTRVQNGRIISDINHHLATLISPHTFFEELSDKDVHALTLKDGSSIPLLKDILPLFKNRTDKTLNLELKSPQVAQATCNMLKAHIQQGHITTDQLIISSFDHNQLPIVQKHLPQAPLGLLYTHSTHAGLPPYKDFKQDNIPIGLGASYAILPTGAFPELDLALLKHAQMQLILWTESEQADPRMREHLEQALASGMLKAIIADNPEETQCLIHTLTSS